MNDGNRLVVIWKTFYIFSFFSCLPWVLHVHINTQTSSSFLIQMRILHELCTPDLHENLEKVKKVSLRVAARGGVVQSGPRCPQGSCVYAQTRKIRENISATALPPNVQGWSLTDVEKNVQSLWNLNVFWKLQWPLHGVQICACCCPIKSAAAWQRHLQNLPKNWH